MPSLKPKSTSRKPTHTSSPSESTSEWHLSFEKSRPAMAALPPTDLATINVDVPSAVSTAYGVLGPVRELRPRLSKLAELDLAAIDNLETYAGALAYAHGVYVIATTPAPDLPALNEEAAGLRQRFLKDATPLAERGLLDAGALGEIHGGVGYKVVAFELFSLVQLIRKSWNAIEGKSAITEEELDRAESLSQQISMAVGERDTAPAAAAEATDTRQRAFTLFVEAYDSVRRAVSYLRWNEGDADTIIPSLWAGRGGRKRPSAGGEPAMATPGAPAVTPAAPAVVAHAPEGSTASPAIDHGAHA